MHCKYLPQDLNARLNNSICRYEGVPYQVMVEEGARLSLYNLGSGERFKRIDFDDPLFDISTPPLGYVNFRVGTLYLVRTPVRRYKQGIDIGNTAWFELPETKFERQKRQHRGERYQSRNGNLFSVEVKDMILGNYRPLREVIESLRGGQFVSRAISREVAFKIDAVGLMSVFFKNELVGHVFPGRNVISVPTSEKAWIVSAHIEGIGMEVE